MENARGNIDIGGPCMIRASAKNFIRVASVVEGVIAGHTNDELEVVARFLSRVHEAVRGDDHDTGRRTTDGA